MSLRFVASVFLAVLWLIFSNAASAQWTAFNDHAPGSGTHSNTTRYHIFANGNPSGGVLRNSINGTNLPVTLTITRASAVANSSTASPTAGTPLANVFGGFVDFTGSPDGSAEVAGAAVVTYAFSGLKTNVFYRFHGSAVRGEPTYVNRWTLCEIVGAAVFTNAHSSANVLTTSQVPALTAAQAAFNSGANHIAATGDYVSWDGIRPGTNGTFSVTCRQYTGTVPSGSSGGSKGYAITGVRLEEISTVQTPPAIAVQPQNILAYEGDTAAISGETTGNPIFYQWFRNGEFLIDETNRTLVIPCIQLEDAGAYSFTVSNHLGIAESSNAQVTVIAPQISEWGRNEYGQVNVPLGLSNVVMMAAGSWHGLALQGDGRVIGWGRNTAGQTSVPPGVVNPSAIAAGFYFSMALMPDRTVRCWGDNLWGQCNVPAGLNDVVMIASAYDTAFALRANGTIVAWGRNHLGQTNIPPGLSNVVKIFAGGYYCTALKSDGTAVAWGGYDPSDGGGSVAVPAGLSNIVALAPANLHTLALRSDGTVAAWGHNSHGQTTVPPGLSNVVAIAAGNGFSGSHSVALKADRSLSVWGYNNNGQSTLPPCLKPGVTVAAGEYYTAVMNATDATTAKPVILASPFVMGRVGNEIAHRFAWRNQPGTLTASGLPPGVTIGSVGKLIGSPRTAGEFAVSLVASNSFGSSQRGVTVIILPNAKAPTIVQHPTNQVVPVGSNATFRVAAFSGVNGASFSVQWFRNDVPIGGGADGELQLNAVQFPDAGSYRARLSFEDGAIWTDAATLRVLNLPRFTTTDTGLDFSNGIFHTTLTELLGYSRVVIECSTNLADWQPVQTNSGTLTTVNFISTPDTNAPARFYRALLTPTE
jgi:hypothetical protein